MRSLRTAVAGVVLAVLTTGQAMAQGIIRDAEIEHMIREYSEPLFEAAGLRPQDVDTYIINDRSMNAFVTGGQNVFLHTGIIIEAETPNELKGVLAHETGHISGGDLSQISQGQRQALGPMLATMAAGILAAAAGEGAAAAALIGSSQQFGLLAFFQHTQAQERQADLSAVKFLEATGQSGEGLIKFFDRFRYQEVMSESRQDPYFRTHPISSDRVEALRPLVAAGEYQAAPDSDEHILMLKRAQAKIYGFLYPPGQTFRIYPDDDNSSEALYARTVAHHRVGSLPQALEQIQELISREPENPYFHELHGQILFENGRTEDSIPPFEQAVGFAPDAPLIRLLLAQALVETREPELEQEALSHITEAMKHEPQNALAWRLRAIIYERRGDTALAQLATAEQRYFSDPFSAMQFAARARQELQPGTPEWIRASDIVQAIQATYAVEGARGRQRFQ